MHVAAGMTLHNLHGKDVLRAIMVTDPHQDAAMGDLAGVRIRMMYAAPACAQHSDYWRRDTANGNGCDGGCRCGG